MGRYVRCTTAGNQQIKQVTELTGFDNHAAGAWFILWLANDNTAVSPKLQINDQSPMDFVTEGGFDDEDSCRRLVHGAYLLANIHGSGREGWRVIAGPAGFYRTFIKIDKAGEW